MKKTNSINYTAFSASRRKVGISAIVYLLYISYYISGYSSFLHNYIYVVSYSLWILAAIFEDSSSFSKAFGNKTVIWALLFLFYFFITSLSHGNLVNTLEYIAKYLMLFSCVLQFKYYEIRRNIREIKFIVVSSLLVWLYFAIKAILFYIAVPSAARTLASDFYAFDNIAIGGGYAIAFGSAILCVFLFELLINNKKRYKGILRLIILCLVLILFYLLIKTESTLTLISCSLGIILAIVRKFWRNEKCKNDLKKVIIVFLLIFSFLVIVLNIHEIGEWIVKVTRDGIDNTIIRRFNRIGQKMVFSGSSYENYVDERFGYIAQSWNTFLKNPIIGIGFRNGNIFSNLKKNGLGMHSAICDLLAQHGILGALLFIMFFVKGLKKECWVYYNTYIFTMLFMAFVNPFDYFHAYFALFTLIPMINIAFNYSENATSINNG